MTYLATLHPSYRMLFAFYFLNPKQLTWRESHRMRTAFFKQQGENIIQQIEAQLPPRPAASRIAVRSTMELLDFFVTIQESVLVEPISNAHLAELLVSIFNIGVNQATITTYLSRNRSEK